MIGTRGQRAVRWLVLALLVTSPAGCMTLRQRWHIRDGLLMRGLHREAFLSEWGPPTRTYTVTGEDAIQAAWGTSGGSFEKGKAVYDVWDYPEREVTLFFAGSKLVTWKTDKTVDELRER